MAWRLPHAILIAGLLVSAQAQEDPPKKKPPPDASAAERIDGHYIPKDLDDCFAELQKLLGAKGVKKLKGGTEEELALYHLSLGMGLRNEWGLWRGSRLAKYFNVMGVFHPDDMSGIILTSFWRHLHGLPLKVDEQVAEYQKYWEEAKKTEAANEERATMAKKRIAEMVLGWTLVPSKLPAVAIPQRHYISNELRARFLAPFRGGAFLAVRGEKLPEAEDWTTVGYFLDPQDEKLHRIEVPEISEMNSALSIGEVAWFSGKARGKPVLVKVDSRQHEVVPLPADQSGPPELGLQHHLLLLVYPHAVFRQHEGSWETLYSGELTLRRSGPPPRLFGSRLCMRDEGEGEDNKRLRWLDFEPKPHIGSLQEEMGVIGPMGPRWENTFSYCVTSVGDLWATMGEGFQRQSLVERSRDGTYHLGIINGSLRFDGELFGARETEEVVKISALLAHEEQLTMVGRSGLYRLVGNTVLQEVAFANTTQVLPVEGGKNTYTWTWDPSDLLSLAENKWLLSATFAGIYILEFKPDKGYQFRCVDESLGKDVTF